MIGLKTSGELYLAAIHLPSLLASNRTIKARDFPDGIGVPTGSMYDRSSFNLSFSINSFHNKSEYSVMLCSSYSDPSTFDIRVEVVADSIYGRIGLIGQRSRVLTDTELQRDVPRDAFKPDERCCLHNSLYIAPSCQGSSVLMGGYGTGHILGTLYIGDLRQSIPLRRIEWRASRRHYGKAGLEDIESASEDGPVRGISYWDTKVGMILLREDELPLTGPGVHQICWF